ncbi:MAG: sulfate ABC transporter substrate-binding protein [Candidatus Omnitrophota bacterium]
MVKVFRLIVLAVMIISFMFTGCSGKQEGSKDTTSVTITLGAYTVPKEAYQKEIIPAFQKMWKQKTGQDVKFQESYVASGAQSRAIAGGFEADVAALSLEDDITRLVKAKLVTNNWKGQKHNGFITRSVVAMAYRPGNPKNIKNWEDLTSNQIDVIYPSPKTSGGAMWIVNAIYGAGLKISEQKGKQDPEYAKTLLEKIQKRVKVMDESGRASVTTFENGIGDVLLTYENEAILRQVQGKDFPFIVPDATILIENPVAIVDKYVEKHGNRTVVEAFVEFLFSQDAQRSFAKYGFRPVDETILTEFQAKYPTPRLLFDIAYLGGWEKVRTGLYGTDGIWTRIVDSIAK